MFLVNSILITLFGAAGLFILFTYFLIFSFTRHFLTALLLTVIFLKLNFIAPFEIADQLFTNRKKILKKVNKQPDLTEEQIGKIRYVFSKKSRLLFFLYKSGAFSYSKNLMFLYERHAEDNLKVEFPLLRQNKNKFNQKIMHEVNQKAKNTITEKFA